MFVIGVLSNGGAERVISVLAKELCDMGYEVDIVTIYGDKNDYIDDERIHIHPLSHSFKNKALRSMEIIQKVRKLIKKREVEIVISFAAKINLYAILACFFLKTKLIVSERNDPYQNPENWFVRKLRDVLYRFSDGFVFQTKDAMEYFPVQIQKNGVIISNPIKSDLPHWDKNSSEKTIITACRLDKQKNLPMLIKAFATFQEEYPDYKLKIFGAGPLREKLLNQIDELKLKDKISLPGFSHSIHNEMVKSDLFIITSNYEGISNSMLEALAIGVPVISTDSPIGGAKMFIKNNENGLLIKVKDIDKLVIAMKNVLTDKNFAIRLSNEAVKIRTELSSERIAQEWIMFIDQICETSNVGQKVNLKI